MRSWEKIWRGGCISVAVVWLLLNIHAWWCLGSYAECGIGVRLLGFFAWGMLLSVIPLVMSVPPVAGDERICRGASVRLHVAVPVALHCGGLICLAPDMPGAAYDGDILAAAGLPAALAFNTVTLLLIGIFRFLAVKLRDS